MAIVAALLLKLAVPPILCYVARNESHRGRVLPSVLLQWLASAVIFWLILMPSGLEPPAIASHLTPSLLTYLPLRLLKWALTIRYVSASWAIRRKHAYFWLLVVAGIVVDFAADVTIPIIKNAVLEGIGAQK